MSEFKHTPGPWSDDRSDPEIGYITQPDDNHIRSPHRHWSVAKVYSTKGASDPSGDVSEEESYANARLIAAAPEMVERGEAMDALLKQLQGHLIDFLRPDGIDADVFADRVACLLDGPKQREAQDGWQALLSKIKGEEQ